MMLRLNYSHKDNSLMTNIVNLLYWLDEIESATDSEWGRELSIEENVIANVLHRILLVHRDLMTTLHTAISDNDLSTDDQNKMASLMDMSKKLKCLQYWIKYYYQYNASIHDKRTLAVEDDNGRKLYNIAGLSGIAMKYQPDHWDTDKQKHNYTSSQILQDAESCDIDIDELLKVTGLLLSLHKYKFEIAIKDDFLIINETGVVINNAKNWYY